MRDFFPWVRFWGKAGTEPALDEDGFLIDPGSELGRFCDVGLRSLGDDKLEGIPCLLLVGSGGEGKTTEIRRLLAPDGKPLDGPDPPGYINLGKVGSEANLDRRLKVWSASCSDSQPGSVLVLDGLDECWDTLPDLIPWLPGALEHLGPDLKVRIASRPGPWVQQLEASIGALWPGRPDAVQTFRLLPLTREDVKLAAEESGIGEPGAFLGLVVSTGLAALAAKPIGVRFLIESYRKTGSLGENRYQLYFDGCLALSTEHDRQRGEDKRHRYLEPNQRIGVASRIAAITAFGGRHIITDPELPRTAEDGEVAVADLAGGHESVKGVDVNVSESAVREVVRHTNLFEPAIGDSFTWAHRTFEEFLAAHWLCERGFSTRQLANLLTTAASGSRRIYPDLVGVAGWVASRRYGFFDLLAQTDPEALIDSDAGVDNNERRQQLATLILARIGDRPALDTGWEWYRRYAKLRNPQMADLLRGVLLALGTPLKECRAAIRMARACRVVELAPDLLRIALDPEADGQIRRTAAAGVGDLGDRDSRLGLRALLDLPARDDPDDAFRGIALSAMRHAGVPAREILPHLRRPGKENVLGYYWMFLVQEFPASLAAGEIGLALEWLDSNASRFEILQIERLVEEFAAAAWRHLGSVGDDVRQHLASLLARGGDAGYRIAGSVRTCLERLAKEEVESRRLLLEAAAAVAGREVAQSGRVPWLFGFAGIARSERLEWLIEKAVAAPADSQGGWVSLMLLVAEPSDPLQREALIEASKCVPALGDVYGPVLQPGGWEELPARQRGSEAPLLPAWAGPSPDLIEELVEKAIDGQWDAWLLLNRQLWRDRDHGRLLWPTDAVCVAPGWGAVPEAVQERIRVACDVYAMRATPSIDDWIDGTTIPDHAAIDYWTLRWAVTLKKDMLGSLPVERLERWAALVAAFRGPGLSGDKYESGHLDLVDRFMEAAPESFLVAVLARMRVEVAAHGLVSAHEQLRRHYRDRAGPALLGFIADSATEVRPLEIVASALLEAGFDPAKNLLLELFRRHEPSRSDEEDLERAVLAAQLLLSHVPDIWPEVWAFLSSDRDFGEKLLERWLSGPDPGTAWVLEARNEDELADLYLWLEDRRASAKETASGLRSDSAWNEVRDLRSLVLGILERRRTRQSVQALERLREALPDLPWLDIHVVRAERNAAAGDWVPVPSGDLLSMARDIHNYVVRSEADLLEIVMEALERYGKDLHGKRHLVRHLWNENPARPKTEAALSDELTDYLRQALCEHGAIINREVQIRPHPKGIGDRTDLLVSATAKERRGSAAEAANVVIEVKGCWNDDLWNAMEAQLAARYLRGAAHGNGIYLVGWYSAQSWQDDDRRKRKCEALDMETVRERLEAQAKDLCRNGLQIRAMVLDATYNLG